MTFIGLELGYGHSFNGARATSRVMKLTPLIDFQNETMNIVKKILALTIFMLVGCATKLPPVEPTYDEPPFINTEKTAKVDYVTGAVVGTLSQPRQVMPVGGMFIAIPTGHKLDARFGSQDQQEVRNLLAMELKRLSIVRAVLSPESNAEPDLYIRLNFVKTELVHLNLFYILDVAMTLQSGSRRVEHNYHIDVYEQDSSAERWNSTFGRNKIKAKKLFLKRAIPDIEKFLTGSE